MRWCWPDVVFPASAPVPSTSQPKKQTYSLPWVLLGEDLVISPTCEVGVAGLIPGKTNCERAWIGPEIPLHDFSVGTSYFHSLRLSPSFSEIK